MMKVQTISEPNEVLDSISLLFNDNGTKKCDTSKNLKHPKVKSSATNEKEYLETVFEFTDLPEINTIDEENIVQLQRKCNFCLEFIHALENNKYPENSDQARAIAAQCESQYVMQGKVLYHLYTPRTKNSKPQLDPDRMILQLVVPENLRKTILENYHDCRAGGGHFGIKKTFAAVRQKYFWPKMWQEINDYVKSCDVCQRSKVDRKGNHVPLNPIAVGSRFSRIHIDILCSLPKTKEGYQYILLIVDSFTKWTECFPLKTQEASEIADILYNEFITRYGAPRSIVSDRGRNFMSKLVSALCELFEIKRFHTSSYHPQTNGTVERANSTLLQTIRAYIADDQSNWPKLLPSIMMAFRSMPNTESTGYSPYEMVFGETMNLPIDTSLIPKQTLPQSVQQYFAELTDRLKVVSKLAKFNQERKQLQAKERHDIKAKVPNFMVGDKVLLKQDKTPQGQSTKLINKRDGPYIIQGKGPNFTYKIRHFGTGKVHKSLINAARLTLYNQRQTEAGTTNRQGSDVSDTPTDPGTPEQNHSQLTTDSEPNETGPTTAEPIGENQDQRSLTSIKIIGASRKGGVQRFRIQYDDGHRVWKYENELPTPAIHDYLQKFNRTGRKRKRKKQKFFIQSQQ